MYVCIVLFPVCIRNIITLNKKRGNNLRAGGGNPHPRATYLPIQKNHREREITKEFAISMAPSRSIKLFKIPKHFKRRGLFFKNPSSHKLHN